MQWAGNQLIDEYHISIIPIILGSGIWLFEKTVDKIQLKLCHSQTNNEIMELIYTRRRPPLTKEDTV